MQHHVCRNMSQYHVHKNYVLLCAFILTVIAIDIAPFILDIVSPLNESRAQNIHIMAEYFVDPSKNHYFFRSHLLIFIGLGSVTITATGLALFSYGFHACAILKVTNYRMRIVMEKNVLRVPYPRRDRIIYDRIVHAVDAHRRAMQFCEFLIASFEKSFLFVIMIGVTSLSMNMFRLLKAVMAFRDLLDIFIPSVLIFVHFCYLFFANYIGQQVTNNNAEIFDTVYNLPWYIASVNVQRSLLFLLRKGNKNFYLSIRGIFDASHENFTKLTTSSLSYFTVIYSMQ